MIKWNPVARVRKINERAKKSFEPAKDLGVWNTSKIDVAIYKEKRPHHERAII